MLKVFCRKHEGIEDESTELNRPFGIVFSLGSCFKGAYQSVSSWKPCCGSSWKMLDFKPLDSLEALSHSELAIGIINASSRISSMSKTSRLLVCLLSVNMFELACWSCYRCYIRVFPYLWGCAGLQTNVNPNAGIAILECWRVRGGGTRLNVQH